MTTNQRVYVLLHDPSTAVMAAFYGVFTSPEKAQEYLTARGWGELIDGKEWKLEHIQLDTLDGWHDK